MTAPLRKRLRRPPLSSTRTFQPTMTAPLRTRPRCLPLSSSATSQPTMMAPIRERPRRLVSTQTRRIVEFSRESPIPSYAILSHRWEEGQEVSLQDMLDLSPAIEQRSGFQKIVNACAQALRDGHSYIWVDTCCINKQDPRGEEQDINSMYAYYWNSVVCYVYLNDFWMTRRPLSLWFPDFRNMVFESSSWFTRGWTLQELLAPSSVRFFTADWKFYGDKKHLGDIIERVTEIPRRFFNRKNIQGAALIEKMSWSVDRETTKPEDCAYCLLGILGVTMKTKYGEGVERAFERLYDMLRMRFPDTERIGPFIARKPNVLLELQLHKLDHDQGGLSRMFDGSIVDYGRHSVIDGTDPKQYISSHWLPEFLRTWLWHESSKGYLSLSEAQWF
ncbi:HET-domain-containing protein [Dendrothele bispora CBS 962.96]|uniref:HET-domain-containing protein n=1 Tax=Dendrothele bispora (strain CBS 962.96) TaxID=1314807 RepID=A0A4S8LV92_DENBC|nr:HET-domain-containing protein [Dendrothele bispora CBS 962.96]